jgi:hypothetical protein
MCLILSLLVVYIVERENKVLIVMKLFMRRGLSRKRSCFLMGQLKISYFAIYCTLIPCPTFERSVESKFE